MVASAVHHSTGMQYLIFTAALVSFYWGQQVIKNTVHCTTAGTVGTWWLSGAALARPVPQSLKRTMTISFGSVCFGSLVVAALQALHALLQALRRQSSRARTRRNAAGV